MRPVSASWETWKHRRAPAASEDLSKSESSWGGAQVPALTLSCLPLSCKLHHSILRLTADSVHGSIAHDFSHVMQLEPGAILRRSRQQFHQYCDDRAAKHPVAVRALLPLYLSSISSMTLFSIIFAFSEIVRASSWNAGIQDPHRLERGISAAGCWVSHTA